MLLQQFHRLYLLTDRNAASVPLESRIGIETIKSHDYFADVFHSSAWPPWIEDRVTGMSR